MKHQEVVEASGHLAASISSLWVERYRPKTLDAIVLSNTNRDIFESFKEKETIPNLLFCGVAGIGKTSLAKIIVNDILNCQYLYINASDESGIDTIRNKVTNFSRVMSLDGKLKVIILDECDGLTQDAQRALRNVMEEYSDHTRFILTANYKHRVIPALQSRCQYFDLTPPLEDYIKRVKSILTSEEIDIQLDDTEVITNIRSYYPDLRKAVNELQKDTATGKLLLSSNETQFAETLFQLIQKGVITRARKSIIENEDKFSGDYTKLLQDIFNVIESSALTSDVKRECLVIVAEYMYRAAFVLDQEINCFACLLTLSKHL